VALMRPSAIQLIEFAKSGGETTLFISLEKGRFEGAVLQPDLLVELGTLATSLEIDQNL
jgi:hypothetical protein